MKDFRGRIAVITGGGTGMGRALAEQLSAEGCHVAMCDVSAENMAETKRLCETRATNGVRVTTHMCDVSAERLSEHLMPEADPEDRNALTDQMPEVFLAPEDPRLAVGNTPGVGKVDDQLTVEGGGAAAAAPAANMYTVKKGDTLSAIAKAEYGDANKYPVIFEANKPMLKDANKIYPGQVLRIPPKP